MLIITNQTKMETRFPKLELSYETFAHKKVSSNYDICLAIPSGKKQFMWFTYEGDQDVCCLLELNKDHKVTKITTVGTNDFNHQLAYGTILYGSLSEKQIFIIEDIYYFCGLLVKHLTFGEKLTYYKTLLTKYSPTQKVALPYMCMVEGDNALLDSLPFYESIASKTAYVTHHLQFRSSKTIAPYLNHVYKKKCVEKVVAAADAALLFPRTDLDHYAQMNLREAVFRVTADVQNDVYHLFAFDGYTNIAYIASRDASVYMNGLFRNIRENTNVDLGEESEDEDIFQNTSLDKYVDLKKEYKMHCVYNAKFKKWAPVRVVDSAARLVSVKELTRQTNRPPNSLPNAVQNAAPYHPKAVHKNYQPRTAPYQPRLNSGNKQFNTKMPYNKKSYKSSYKNIHK
jgi:hypothetical protein